MNSTNANGLHPPKWDKFLEEGISRCTGSTVEMKSLLKEGDLLSCCQLIKIRMGLQWINFIQDQFLTPSFQSAEIHKEIFELDASIVVTPNFDKIYDNFANKQSNGFLKVKKFYDDDLPLALRGGAEQRLILKIHGCIDTPHKLIFTREDYAKARHDHNRFYRFLEGLFLTHTFLFIGCGMKDPDLNLLLEQYAHSFSGAPANYVLLSTTSKGETKNLLNSNYNLDPLFYSPKDEHKELLDSIRDLKNRVSNKREEIAQRWLW